MSRIVEKGEIYLFYRKKIDVKKPSTIDDVQRLHMVLIPDTEKKNRLLIVGKKRLPEMEKSSGSNRREWSLVVLADEKTTTIRDELLPTKYETKTKGTRREPGSVPAAEGRYVLFIHEDHTELAYKINQPKKMGKVQRELGIHQEARYIVSVKNPNIRVRGFSNKKPKYPSSLEKKFKDLRWIDVRDSRLLDYENTQLLLIGAGKSLKEIDIKVTGKPTMFKKLKAEKESWPTKSLYEGLFTTETHANAPTAPKGDRAKGGRRGGVAAVDAPSAAGIAKSLKNIDFPASKKDLVSYAQKQNAKKEIISTLENLPSRRKFQTMADVQKALGEVR